MTQNYIFIFTFLGVISCILFRISFLWSISYWSKMNQKDQIKWKEIRWSITKNQVNNTGEHTYRLVFDGYKNTWVDYLLHFQGNLQKKLCIIEKKSKGNFSWYIFSVWIYKNIKIKTNIYRTLSILSNIIGKRWDKH